MSNFGLKVFYTEELNYINSTGPRRDPFLGYRESKYLFYTILSKIVIEEKGFALNLFIRVIELG